MDEDFPPLPDFDVNSLLVSIESPELGFMFGQMSLQKLEQDYQNTVRTAILFGVRVGAAFLTLIAMHLVSKKSRTKLLFLANQTSIIMLIVHAALYFRYLLGPFSSILFYTTNLMGPESDENDLNVSVATNVFVLLMILSVQVSLAIQTRSVFHAWLKSRIYITVALILLSLVVFTFWTTHTIVTSYALAHKQKVWPKMGWTRLASDISFATSISIASLVLLAKLVASIRVRKTLGKKPLGYTKVLMIMSTQSLVVPAIMIIVNYALPKEDAWIFSGVAYLIVVLSLPLSSIWATTVNDEELQSSYLMSALNTNSNHVTPKEKTAKLKTPFLSRLRPFSTFTNRDDESNMSSPNLSCPALPSPESDVTFSNGGFGPHNDEKMEYS